MAELGPGVTLSHYHIVSKIGAGGMGEVYLAQDTKLDRKVALKILPADVAAHADRMKRFVQEAKAASALNHPNILTIYEIDQTDSGHFIATEFIDGETLRERESKGSLRLAESLEIATQIASAVAAAHAAGIVHRDVKPENVMIRRDGIVKVLDFGLAKLTDRASTEPIDNEAPTRANIKTDPVVVMGTAVYMSPEQARGLTLDARTDIFSLGVVLYEMVAGRLPFEGSNRNEIMASVLSDKEPQPLTRYSSEAPDELGRIVLKALRKNRDERYQTIKDMLLDLKSLQQELEYERKLDRSALSEFRLQAAQSSLEIGDFDSRAAIELAALHRKFTTGKSKRKQKAEDTKNAIWAKISFDRQLVAIAKIYGVRTIYSDDKGVKTFAERNGITVIRSWELPRPPGKQLPLYREDEGANLIKGDHEKNKSK